MAWFAAQKVSNKPTKTRSLLGGSQSPVLNLLNREGSPE